MVSATYGGSKPTSGIRCSANDIFLYCPIVISIIKIISTTVTVFITVTIISIT